MALIGTVGVAKSSYRAWKAQGAARGAAGEDYALQGDYAVPAVPGPWGPTAYELIIIGQGGWKNLERVRETMALGSYAAYVRENRKVTISGDSIFENKRGSVSVEIKKYPDPSIDGTRPVYAGIPWGHDELVVDGDMDWKCKERVTLLSGSVDRVWEGTVARMVGMEGTICGGAFSRVFAGAVSTTGAVASGDVYGGCGRAAAARVYLGGMGYRSSDAAMWNIGLYRRSAATVLEPAVGTLIENAAKKDMAVKALKVLSAACPIFDIAAGLVGMAVSIGNMIAARMGRTPLPPNVAPRIKTRNVGAKAKTGQQTVI